jgi:hypothetical protein
MAADLKLHIWYSPKSVGKHDVRTEMKKYKCDEHNMPWSSRTRKLGKSSIKSTLLLE